MIPSRLIIQVDTTEFDNTRLQIRVYIDDERVYQDTAIISNIYRFTASQFDVMLDQAVNRLKTELRGAMRNDGL
jgi:hypothetical protein